MLKSHPDVFDVLVVGVPDERWGERVTAVVQAREGRTPSVEELDAHCRTQIAAYKAPKQVFLVDQISRGTERQARLPLGQGVRQERSPEVAAVGSVRDGHRATTRPPVSTIPTRRTPATGSSCCTTSRRQGVSLAQMVAANESGSLHAVVTDTRVRPGRVVTEVEIAAKTGIPVELLRRITLAAGVMVVDDDYRESDLATFELFARERGLVRRSGDPAVHAGSRVLDGPSRRCRDFAVPRECRGSARQGGVGREVARRSNRRGRRAARRHSGVDGWVVPPPRPGRDQPAASANRATRDPSMFRLAVGFVDLVGFTPYAQDVTSEELAGFVETFEARANDVVAARGGRVVKHIGDEVMFVDADPVTACDIALATRRQLRKRSGGVAARGRGLRPARRPRRRLLRVGRQPRVSHRRPRSAR